MTEEEHLKAEAELLELLRALSDDEADIQAAMNLVRSVDSHGNSYPQ